MLPFRGQRTFTPTFLQVQHGFGPHEVGLIAVIYKSRRHYRRYIFRFAL